VQKVIAVHGYIVTAMASLLVASREAGVLSTAEILWLKTTDRRMWYMLNSVGRYTAMGEIAGAFAHWLAEKKLGLPLVVPMVEEAVKGLELALSDILYKPEEK
jgi:intracellular multiplication protein IcmP